MQYKGRYLRLMDYVGGITDTDVDRAYYFLNGMLGKIGSMMVTTSLGTVQEAYARSMSSETFLSTRTGTIVAAQPPAQPDVRLGGDRRRKRPRQWKSRDRAQSVGFVASPPPSARIAPRPYASV
ncbi:hypothetical protein Scep_021929 [Stephania cephalantha]|uniref:Uncharacterized protein n=1 Tax=Stephania cephalantha TaxID=152367 RepID=A0AAP0F4D2_9MAGN